MSEDLGSVSPASSRVSLSSSPFVHDQATTPWIMFQVLFALVPVLLLSLIHI